MEKFEERINIGTIQFLFKFTRIVRGENNRLVATGSGGGIITTFEMIKDSSGRWRIIQPAPEWILQSEFKIIRLLSNKGL